MCITTKNINNLTNKHLEMHAYVVSTMATDALVLKYQAISIHSADYNLFYWTSSIQKYCIYNEQHYKI